MITDSLRRKYQFFRRSARARAAMNLARAEEWLCSSGARIEWEGDDHPYETDDPDDCPAEVLGCILSCDGEHVSLWGIGDPTPEYQRVVEAELAVELRERIDQRWLDGVLSI